MPPVSDFVHTPKGTSSQALRTAILNSVGPPADKPPRTCPPKACTSAAQVGVALSDALDLEAIYQTQIELLRLVARASDPREIEQKLRQIKVGAEGQVERAARLVAFLDEVQARLRHAEDIQNWDDLRGQEPTGTEIAKRIRQCLDDIADASADDTDVADARGDLAGWFENYPEDALDSKTIRDILGQKRRGRLKEERMKWERARKVAAS